ncbi:MAG: keto-hydroxyglutarate-aldolase/keto-deoxy-phosphogluconate aldolase, partial [Lawsonibacter sp.]
FEMMKAPGRGKNGHVAIGVNSLPRARAYLERLGIAFDESTAGPKAIYFAEEIGGFAFHLLQK